MATAPTIQLIRAWSDLDFVRFGYPDDATGNARLQLQVDRALAYLGYVTGRQYVDPQTDVFPLVKTALDQAVQMRTEQVVLALASDQLETAGDVDMIASFSAGPYTESRKDTLAQPERRALNPWPALNDLLWMLLGLFPGEDNDRVMERFDYWRYLLSGITAPAWQTVEVNWGRGMGLNDWWSTFHNVLPPGPIPEWNDSRIG